MLHLSIVASAVAVSCPVHGLVWQNEVLSVSDVVETECAADQFCAREMVFVSSGRGLAQKCMQNPYLDFGRQYEASVGSCCRQSGVALDTSHRLILFDMNPGVLTNITERNAYMD